MWDDMYLWKYCLNHIIRICVSNFKFQSILAFCHNYACKGHFRPKRSVRKVLVSVFYWSTLFYDSYIFCKNCKQCKQTGNLTCRNELVQTLIIVVEIFYVQGIDFMGLFPLSSGLVYILFAVNYVSKWAKVKATRIDDSKAIIGFVKSNIFNRFGIPQTMINDQGLIFAIEQQMLC